MSDCEVDIAADHDMEHDGQVRVCLKALHIILLLHPALSLK